MKVILTKDVSGLGRTGDVKEVSDGYARNFLIPKHLVLPATTGVLAKVQKEESEHQAKIKRDAEHLVQVQKKLHNQAVTIRAKAQKTHLFAAVKEPEIAKALNEKFKTGLSADQISLDKPLKSLGIHEVMVRLAPNTQAKVLLTIEGHDS